MAVQRKGRRVLVRNHREFIWWIAPGRDGAGEVLHVISDDKKFHVLYELGQFADLAFLCVLGKEFAGLPDAGGVWLRVRTPAWNTAAIGPGFVRKLIDWCLDESRPVVRVDWRGKVIGS